MAALIFVCFLIGAALGLRFKVLVVLPATALVLTIVVTEELARGDGGWPVLISAIAVAAALQFGFIVGSGVASVTGGPRGKPQMESQEQRTTRDIVKPTA